MAYIIDVKTIPNKMTFNEAIKAIEDGKATALGIQYTRIGKPQVSEYDSIKCSCKGVDVKDCKC